MNEPFKYIFFSLQMKMSTKFIRNRKQGWGVMYIYMFVYLQKRINYMLYTIRTQNVPSFCSIHFISVIYFNTGRPIQHVQHKLFFDGSVHKKITLREFVFLETKFRHTSNWFNFQNTSVGLTAWNQTDTLRCFGDPVGLYDFWKPSLLSPVT